MEMNGFKIVGVLPILRSSADGVHVKEYVICGQRPEDGECVTARVEHLAVTSWNWGHYFDNLSEALADMNERAGLYATV